VIAHQLRYVPTSDARMSAEARELRALMLKALIEGRALPLELLGGTTIPPTITSGLR
jgi:hypothetical protein